MSNTLNIQPINNITNDLMNKSDVNSEDNVKKKSESSGRKIRKNLSFKNPFRLSTKRNNKNSEDCNQCDAINSENDKSDDKKMIKTEKIENLSAKESSEGVNIINGGTKKTVFRRSSFKKFLTRIAQQMTSINIGPKQERVPPLNSYVWPPDTTPGVIGLRNHGNTCFMNAVLQCLSHTDIIAEYFVLDQYKADLKRRNKLNSKKFGTKGELTEQLALVLKALWTCKDAPDYSTSFKAAVDRYGSQFRSSTQHDAQEFLFWLLDKVHEDLNTATKRRYKSVKNNYGRPDEVLAAETLANHIRCNNSFVQAVFQAQFRSSLTCPRCHKQSNTFDPFHCISVQLPQLQQQSVFVKVIYLSQQPRQVKLGLKIPQGSPLIALREQLQADTGIAQKRLIIAEINETGFSRIFCDSHAMSSICETDPIYCIETPEPPIDATTTKSSGNEGASTKITLCVTNVKKIGKSIERFGTPFCIQVNRDISYLELQKQLLKELSSTLKSDVVTITAKTTDTFRIYLQDPSADPDTYLEESVEHPLFTEMIDLALSVLPTDVGPSHIKLLLEWQEPTKYFNDMSDTFVEHESVQQLKDKLPSATSLTLEQCLEHYTKAETLSAEDAWRCPHCQKYLPVVKTLGLWSLPDIMVIHFKRFRQQQFRGPQSAKLTTMVKFPLRGFDMTPHLARNRHIRSKQMSESTSEENNLQINQQNEDDENWSPWRRTLRRNQVHHNSSNNTDPNSQQLPPYMDNLYDLYAVCYHQGDTLETGHYTAACLNPYDQQWYKFDDHKVSHVLNEVVPEQIVNNEAYILFYQRRKFDDSMECSGTSSTSTSGLDHWVSRIAASTITVSMPLVPVPVTVKLPEVSAPLSPVEEKDMVEVKDIEEKIIMVKECPVLPKLPIVEVIVATSVVIKEELSPLATPDLDISDEPISSPVSEPTTVSPQPIIDSTETIIDIRKEAQPLVPFVENDSKYQRFSSPPILKSIKEESSSLLKENLHFSTASITINGHASSGNGISKQWLASPYLNSKKNRREICKSDEIIKKSTIHDILWNRQELSKDFATMNGLTNGSNCWNNNSGRDSCDTAATISMIRGANSCSKDTLLYIDQQHNGLSMDDDEDDLLENSRALWISPVTPHKLITVSPKN